MELYNFFTTAKEIMKARYYLFICLRVFLIHFSLGDANGILNPSRKKKTKNKIIDEKTEQLPVTEF